ncbi:MAG: hypothetical protein LBN10_09495 [Propionibacteriaceae bacterium]|jgi:membrane protein DedA with SNARE-associated domain|nr:hypothetical protein [Propionibacteriaceae bacterium]
MLDWITGQPFWIAAVFLTGVAGFRSQATYWLGRGIREGAVRTKWAKSISSEKEQRAVKALEKWGWPIIPVSFLTLGFQTAVQLTAGLLGWRWFPYTMAAIPGWILWGCVYAAGGLAVFIGLFALAAKSWWLAGAVVLLVAGLIAGVIIWRRRHKVVPAVD